MDKNIIIIGGGPGGYVAAIRGAQLGARVTLIEEDKMGGTCLNRGCIPTKTLYKNAELLNTLKHIEDFGISVGNVAINLEQIHKRKNEVVSQLVGGVEQLLKANNVEVLRGHGSLKDKNTVLVTLEDGTLREVKGENIIIATGSRPSLPPIKGAELDGVYKAEEILNFENIPERLAVIGGGVIGMEFACIFNALGTKVTILEFLPGILSQIDSDLIKRLTPSLKKRGIDINTSTGVTEIEKKDGTYIVHASGKKGEIAVEADAVLVSTGRMPVTGGLNLEGIGVEFDRKGIKVNENLETSVEGIYAIGDVNGKIMLAHAASHQGIEVVERIMGIDQSHHDSAVPGCVFIFPEIAYAGITEDEAKAKGISYSVSKFMFGANGKALASGDTEGMVKVISSEDVIIGVHIMGPHASDLIHEGALAVSNKMKIEDIKHTIHAHPTLSEAFTEAVMGLDNEAIHMAPSRR